MNYVENRVEKARSEGFNQGKGQISRYKPASVEKIINEIRNVKGIGSTKMAEIQAILEKHLEVSVEC